MDKCHFANELNVHDNTTRTKIIDLDKDQLALMRGVNLHEFTFYPIVNGDSDSGGRV